MGTGYHTLLVFIGGNNPHLKKRNNSMYHEQEANRLWGKFRVGYSQSGLVLAVTVLTLSNAITPHN